MDVFTTPRSICDFFPHVRPITVTSEGLEPHLFIDQIAFLVPDIRQAMNLYGMLYGWTHWHVIYDVESAMGKNHEDLFTLHLAFAQPGDIEVELIQHVAGQGPHAEHRDTIGYGFFQMRLATSDIHHAIRHMETKGIKKIAECWDQGVLINAWLGGPQSPLGYRIELVLSSLALKQQGFDKSGTTSFAQIREPSSNPHK